MAKKGYLSAENPLAVAGSESMTVDEAQKTCATEPACKGFTFMLSTNTAEDPTEKTSIHFKTVIDFTKSEDSGWRTKIKASEAGLLTSDPGMGGRSCTAWRNAGGCTASGPREAANDLACSVSIDKGKSGYCECEDGRKAAESTCHHDEFTCADECAKTPSASTTSVYK